MVVQKWGGTNKILSEKKVLFSVTRIHVTIICRKQRALNMYILIYPYAIPRESSYRAGGAGLTKCIKAHRPITLLNSHATQSTAQLIILNNHT